MQRRRRRDRFSIRKYLTVKNIAIAAAAILTVVAIVLVIALQSSLQTANKETIAFEYTAQGVIIRNEKLYKTDVSSRNKLVAEEGGGDRLLARTAAVE